MGYKVPHALYSRLVYGILKMLRPLIAAWLATLLLITSGIVLAQNSSSTYQLGRGYKVGNTGIRLGGYIDVHFNGYTENAWPWSAETGDLSLLVSWNNGSKLTFFSELEVEDALSVGQHFGPTTNNAHFSLERLYVDYLVNDTLSVRLGKILTPIGQWNLLHADPLVWTTTRPVATENLFSKRATGIMLHGSMPVGDQSVDYAVYGDYSSTLDPSPADDFDNAVGMRLRYNINDDLQIGLSYIDFSEQSNRSSRNHLLGLDVAWTYQRLSITSEIVYRNNDAKVNEKIIADAWQGYIQGVGRIAGHVYGVGRYEFFDQLNLPSGQVGVLGLAYHPKPPLIWKLEYRLGTNNRFLAPDGLFASFAVLF